MYMGYPDAIMIPTAVLRLDAHCSGAPSGVADQS
jgi:hypothetical protein